jgi:hypothetical protein
MPPCWGLSILTDFLFCFICMRCEGMVLTSIPLIRHDAGYDINIRRHNNLVGLVKMRVDSFPFYVSKSPNPL